MKGCLLLALLAAGCQAVPDPEVRSVPPVIPSYSRRPRRPKPPFEPSIVSVAPSPAGTFGSRFDVNSPTAKYLDFFHPIEPEAALIRIHLTNRERTFPTAYAEYPSGDIVEFGEHGNLKEQERYRREQERVQGKTERKQVLVNGQLQWIDLAVQPKLPKDLDIDVSVPWGYGPSLRKGKLVLVSDNDVRLLPLAKLPKPVATNVDSLPPVTHIGPPGKGIGVVLKRGMNSVHLAPSPADDPKGYEAAHHELQYTGAFFSTTVDPGFAPGKTVDLVMRLKRTKWCDRPGKWFVLQARNVLDDAFEPVDQYSLSVDPSSKMAEFECVVVETRAWTEKAVIPSFGSLSGAYEHPDKLVLGATTSARTPSGWIVVFEEPGRPMIVDDGSGELPLPTHLLAPDGKQPTDEIDPLKDAHFVSDIQMSAQKSRPSDSPSEPTFGPRGDWKIGPLGDATITVCHLQRTVHPATILRLPLRTGGKPSGQEFYINADNMIQPKKKRP